MFPISLCGLCCSLEIQYSCKDIPQNNFFWGVYDICKQQPWNQTSYTSNIITINYYSIIKPVHCSCWKMNPEGRWVFRGDLNLRVARDSWECWVSAPREGQLGGERGGRGGGIKRTGSGCSQCRNIVTSKCMFNFRSSMPHWMILESGSSASKHLLGAYHLPSTVLG